MGTFNVAQRWSMGFQRGFSSNVAILDKLNFEIKIMIFFENFGNYDFFSVTNVTSENIENQ